MLSVLVSMLHIGKMMVMMMWYADSGFKCLCDNQNVLHINLQATAPDEVSLVCNFLFFKKSKIGHSHRKQIKLPPFLRAVT